LPLVTPIDHRTERGPACWIALGCAGDILWVPGGEHCGREFPKVTAPPLDPDNRKEEW
jgi:hypothetical protein